MASLLLGLAVVNPLCCCLAEVLDAALADQPSLKSCCDMPPASDYPEPTPAQEPPCECAEQVTLHKEAWPEDRLFAESMPQSSLVASDLPAWIDRFAGRPLAPRYLGTPPLWQLHCIRLL